MQRYWIFLLFLAPIGCLWPITWFCESYLVLWPVMQNSNFNFASLGFSEDVFWAFWKLTAPWGAFGGMLLGLLAIAWAWLRKRTRAIRDEGLAVRCAGNLFWCHLYPFAVLMLNGVVWGILSTLQIITVATMDSLLYVLCILSSLLGTGILSILALIWATFRSINTNDILAPGLLISKLRRSMSLEAHPS